MKQHVIIIGGGMVGIATAVHLQRLGYEITIIEKNEIAKGTSYGNAGILASCSCSPVQSPNLIFQIPKMLFANQSPLFIRWQDIVKLAPFLFKFLLNCKKERVEKIADALSLLLHDCPTQHMELAQGTGAQKFINNVDWLFGYQSQQEFTADNFAWQLRQQRGHKFTTLAENEIADIFKNKFQKIIACQNTAFISDPQQYIKTLFAFAKTNGAKFLKGKVTDFIIEEGRAKGVIVNNEKIMGEHVVLAAGIWSGELAKKAGYKIPMQAERGYHIEFINPSINLPAPIMIAGGKFVLTPMQGRLRAAGIVEFGGLSEQQNEGAFLLLKEKTLALFPELKYDKMEKWMGYRPTTTDSLPLIGEADKVKKLWLAFGHQHIGLSSGAKTGKWIAGLIAKQKLNVDLSVFNPDRFNATLNYRKTT